MARKKVISKTVTKATQYEYGYESKQPQPTMEPVEAQAAVPVREAVRRQSIKQKGNWNPLRRKKKFNLGQATSEQLVSDADALSNLYGGK